MIQLTATVFGQQTDPVPNALVIFSTAANEDGSGTGPSYSGADQVPTNAQGRAVTTLTFSNEALEPDDVFYIVAEVFVEEGEDEVEPAVIRITVDSN